MNRLSCAKPSGDLGWVFHNENWRLVQSTQGVSVFLRDWLSSELPLTFGTKENIPKSATWTWYDHYEFLVMSFGLSCTPSVFMDLMMQTFHEYLDKWLVECIIDMLIYLTIRVEHGRHLVSVLEVLSKRDSSPSSWEVSFGWGSVLLGSCNEQEWVHSQHIRTWTHNCTYA